MRDFFYRFKIFLSWFLVGIFLVIPVVCLADTQADLELELKNIEQQIAEYSSVLAKTQTEKATLANKIKQLKIRQQALGLQIKATALKLNEISKQVVVVKNNISAREAKEKELNQEIAGTLKEINFIDNNFILSLFDTNGISGVFNKIQNYSDLVASLKNLLTENREVKAKLTEDKLVLEDKKTDTANLLQIKSIQQQELGGSIGEQNQLLAVTKGKESSYQSMLADSKKRAAAIRNRIYELFNTGSQINFGQAVDMAKWASGLTGVRSAFLLAVLTQESNLGKNVGTCNRSGDPETKSWRVIMKPERDQEPFKTITDELGLNIDTTPVSCPMRDKNGNQVGWGGAMGPAQFIPSTWMGYRSKITALTGKSTANPWDIRDAFLAAAIKLHGDGADGTDDGDWKAAMRYFSGGTNTKYRFYGDNVLATTKKYLADIAELK